MQAWSLDTLSSIRLRRNSPPSPHSRSLNKVGMIHHQRWQEDHTRASPGPCIPVQDWDRSDLPALTTKKFTEFDFKKDLQEDGEKDFRVMDLESCVLTPWVDKLPIIAHLVMTMFVSGNIARSQAPSLLSSSANPYQKKKKGAFPVRSGFGVEHDAYAAELCLWLILLFEFWSYRDRAM